MRRTSPQHLCMILKRTCELFAKERIKKLKLKDFSLKYVYNKYEFYRKSSKLKLYE